MDILRLPMAVRHVGTVKQHCINENLIALRSFHWILSNEGPLELPYTVFEQSLERLSDCGFIRNIEPVQPLQFGVVVIYRFVCGF